MLEASQLLMGLKIAVAVMLIIVLYHTLFVLVDVRKVVRRLEDVTAQIEEVFMKPLSMADQILEVVVGFIEKQYEETTKSKKSKKKK